MATPTTKTITRSDGVQLRQTVTNGHVTATQYLAPDGSWQTGRPQAAPGVTWTEANGDKVRVGPDGSPSVDAAPHGALDQIAHWAPPAILTAMAVTGGYNALSGLRGAGTLAGGGTGGGGGATPLAGVGGSAGANAGVPAMPWTLGAGSEGLLPGGAIPGAFNAVVPSVASSPVSGSVAPYVGSALVNGTQTGGGGFWNGLKNLGKGLLGLRGNGNKDNGTNPYQNGINTGLDLLNAYLGSKAAKDAAQAQIDAANKALDFEKQRYGDAQNNFRPYIEHGQQANTAFADAMMPANGQAPTAANLGPQFMAPFQQNAQNNGQRMVTMRAPNGETRQVPDFQVPHYSAQGATVVS